MSRGKFLTLLVTLLVVAAMAVPAAAMSTANTVSGSPQIDVVQSPTTGEATVTVTHNGSVVENATVDVSGDSYAGNGTYSTDANGTVTLPNPNTTVDVTVDVNASGATATKNVTLVPLSESLSVGVSQDSDGNATVTVTQYGSAAANASVTVSGDDYAGNGTYSTDANGTVWLPSPDQPVNVTIAASHNNVSAETTTVLLTYDLVLDVSQDSDGNTTVTVTRNGDPVENATVDVSGDSYAGNGTYSTDANGTVWLPSPDQPVNVTITATEGNDTVSKSVHLLTYDLHVDVTQHDDKTATVNVTRNGDAVENASVNVTSASDYAGTGTYTTDANGSVPLPAPDHNITIDVTATHDDDTATTTAALEGTKTADDLGIGVSQGADRVVIAITDAGDRQNATVTISGNSTLAGTYQTGSDGFLVLDAPSTAANVTISAETENSTGERMVHIKASRGNGPSHTPFGKYVSAYVDSIHHDSEISEGYGQYVSDFVHAFKDSGKENAAENGNGPGAGNAHGNDNGNAQANGHGNGNAKANGHGNGNDEARGDGHPGNGKAKGKQKA